MFNIGIINAQLNNLEQTNNYLYVELINKRKKRYNTALQNSIDALSLNYIPKPSLEDLQEQLKLYEKYFLLSANEKIKDTLDKIKNKILAEDYLKDTDPEYQIKQTLLAHTESFVWPDANELAIRQQEEAELMALLN